MGLDAMELARELALVVHDHEVRARHRHQGQLHVENPVLGVRLYAHEALGVEEQP